MITEELIERLSAMAGARMAKPPVRPERPFPLVLREAWRVDIANPRFGRLRALALITCKPNTPRPALFKIAAE